MFSCVAIGLLVSVGVLSLLFDGLLQCFLCDFGFCYVNSVALLWFSCFVVNFSCCTLGGVAVCCLLLCWFVWLICVLLFACWLLEVGVDGCWLVWWFYVGLLACLVVAYVSCYYACVCLVCYCVMYLIWVMIAYLVIGYGGVLCLIVLLLSFVLYVFAVAL